MIINLCSIRNVPSTQRSIFTTCTQSESFFSQLVLYWKPCFHNLYFPWVRPCNGYLYPEGLHQPPVERLWLHHLPSNQTRLKIWIWKHRLHRNSEKYRSHCFPFNFMIFICRFRNAFCKSIDIFVIFRGLEDARDAEDAINIVLGIFWIPASRFWFSKKRGLLICRKHLLVKSSNNG